MRQADLDFVLTRIIRSYPHISDILFTVDRPIQVESNGELVSINLTPPITSLSPFQTETAALRLMHADRRLVLDLLHKGSCDFSYEIEGKVRFRVNVFSQRNSLGIVMRKLPVEIPAIESLGLPAVFKKMAQEKNGIILFTGATGTGKTTSLAAILNEINRLLPVHVITLEDPIEYIHAHQKATFNQRELGSDFDSYAHGLRAALRQAPKVILVGEIRDRETLEIALTAAETGHLVFSTLHTVDAAHTLNRVMGMFPLDEERQVRTRLAGALRWVVCQRLLPQVSGGRLAIFEIMGTSLRIQELILNGEAEGKTFYDIIESSRPFGSQTFDQDILDAYEQGAITEDTAQLYASKRSVVNLGIDQIKNRRGEKTTDISGLKLDVEYDRQRNRR
ncbi:MAG: PilT/PilU family type 4a pilus ATPase [Desulfobacterota bacterium]|jgi:twitching motility protein PilT|nr:PilT/PilU family type 4a pilus ATPase [Thermodesulfobacteriota bacterium]